MVVEEVVEDVVLVVVEIVAAAAAAATAAAGRGSVACVKHAGYLGIHSVALLSHAFQQQTLAVLLRPEPRRLGTHDAALSLDL